MIALLPDAPARPAHAATLEARVLMDVHGGTLAGSILAGQANKAALKL
jgi:hypothetical protein